MTKDAYIEFCKNLVGADTDQPFNEHFESTVARHFDSKKWFALVMEYQGKTVVNLKCDPMESDFLRSVFKGVIPAYHMNKVHWNTVFLESDVPDKEIERMTLTSFELTDKKKRMPKKSSKKSPKNPL